MGKTRIEVALADCPFCGSPAMLREGYQGMDELDEIWVIECSQCPAEMRATRQDNPNLADIIPDGLTDLIMAWSSRHER